MNHNPVRPTGTREPRSFDYIAIDGSRFATETTLGRVTLILLITTYDLGSQVVIREAADLYSRHRPRINAGALVLEPPKNGPLAEGFAAALDLGFPLVLADPATLEGRGPFGDVTIVPTALVLNPRGEETYRHEGRVSTSELERALSDAL